MKKWREEDVRDDMLWKGGGIGNSEIKEFLVLNMNQTLDGVKEYGSR
jgi:hypothetical protein